MRGERGRYEKKGEEKREKSEKRNIRVRGERK